MEKSGKVIRNPRIDKTQVLIQKQETLEDSYRNMSNRVANLSDRNSVLEDCVSKIYKIWDGFFKTIGVVLSFVIVVGTIILSREAYYLNGEFKYIVVFFGAIVSVAVLAVLIWLVWAVTNSALINKINRTEVR